HYNRQEGLYYGAMSLIQKLSSGLGSFFAGVIADFSGLSGLGDQVMATPENLSRFGWTVAPAGVMITLISIQLIRKYDITRAKHAKTLQELAGRKIMELSND
ncbi:MAG: hypothetical protein GY839_09945, partial [candidate division Zixibacteria bacterium]|nr:hypothetical protein [candidate division Zixibacteria bacterium]